LANVPLLFLSKWCEFPSAPCLAERKLDDSSRLDVEIVARRLTCFLSASVTRKTCNSAHEHIPLSNDTIDSVLRHREVGRDKDLPALPPKATDTRSEHVYFPMATLVTRTRMDITL